MNYQERSLLGQQMRKEVSDFQASGIPISQFCQDKAYTHHKLNYWIGKVRKENQAPPTSDNKGFSSLKPGLFPTATGFVSAEITYPNGMRVSIYEQVTANFLKSLL